VPSVWLWIANPPCHFSNGFVNLLQCPTAQQKPVCHVNGSPLNALVL
jgi:hypothetical protein